MTEIINPILPGFNPDPSIIRVGEDYYVATSTFEWFPGVQIHHSKDLIHWKLIAHPLNRVSQLDLRGNFSSHGVWAPCLTYDNGIFYLIYTNTVAFEGIWQDTHNYLITTTDICGEWSDPVYLNSSGFDPSLFHDDDGCKYLINLVWDYRKNQHPFGGILLQEYSIEKQKLVGPITNIFKGSELRVTEGSHLYKFHGYYFLLTAEGGTGLNHAVTIARSKKLTGPYEVDPNNPMLTSKDDRTLSIQKAGHADIVETQFGEWYMVHLGSRPLDSNGRCPLGRESFIQKVHWNEDGWLRLEAGGHRPQMKVNAPKLPEHPWDSDPERDDFDSPTLNIHFSSLRVPLDESALSLTDRPGYVRLKGKESLISRNYQSLIARRQQAFCYTATTCVEFEPDWFKQMAGLVCYYNTKNFYYLRISHDDSIGKCLGIVTRDCAEFDYPLEQEVCIEGWDRCYLRVAVEYDQLQFYYSDDELNWTPIGPVLDASILSDEYARKSGEKAFTGAFVGICCQDLSGQNKHADFDYFEYTEHGGGN